MPYADLGDYKFYYQEFGDRSNPSVVLLHAFTLDSRMWEADAKVLSENYYVIAPDFKGHGKSDAPISGYTRDERVADLMKFFDKLNLKDIHLVGLSYGGTTALGIVLRHPERIKSLTLIGTSAAGYKLGTKISRIDKIAKEKGIEAAKEKWIKTALIWYRKDQQRIKEFVEMMMREHSGAVWNDPKRGHYPQLNDIEQVQTITIPTKIIVGDSDNMFLPLSKKLHTLIPNSELSIIENCGHLVNLEVPKLFRSEIKSFLTKQLD